MKDKNGRKIKRGGVVCYEQKYYKVLYAGSLKIALSDGDTKEILHITPDCLGEKVLNLEVIK